MEAQNGGGVGPWRAELWGFPYAPRHLSLVLLLYCAQRSWTGLSLHPHALGKPQCWLMESVVVCFKAQAPILLRLMMPLINEM